jgi:hypothetical protein
MTVRTRSDSTIVARRSDLLRLPHRMSAVNASFGRTSRPTLLALFAEKNELIIGALGFAFRSVTGWN